jgi:predicted enzyme related to lactoylglutathione lyase
VKDIDATCAELKAKGAIFTRGPETIRPGTRIAFLSGPEGVYIELLQRTQVA